MTVRLRKIMLYFKEVLLDLEFFVWEIEIKLLKMKNFNINMLLMSKRGEFDFTKSVVLCAICNSAQHGVSAGDPTDWRWRCRREGDEVGEQHRKRRRGHRSGEHYCGLKFLTATHGLSKERGTKEMGHDASRSLGEWNPYSRELCR